MRQIYQQADDVLIFLGRDLSPEQRGPAHGRRREKVVFQGNGLDSDLVNKTLSQIGRPGKQPTIRAVHVFSLLHLLSRERSHDLLLNELSKIPEYQLNRLFEGLRRMLTLKWWMRIWVVQEAIVAQKITVMYSNVSAPWSMLYGAAISSMRLHRRIPARSTVVSPDDTKVLGLFTRVTNLNQFRATWRASGGEGLLTLLRHFGSREASDHRDRIYALLGLCESEEFVQPNYQLNDRQTYTNVTLRIMAAHGSLFALSGDLGRKNQPNLPSWVPDWSWALDEHDHIRSHWFDKYSACGPNSDFNIVSITEDGGYETLRRHNDLYNDLIWCLNRVQTAESPSERLPEWVRPGLERLMRNHQSYERVCGNLMEFCHPEGQWRPWGRIPIAFRQYQVSSGADDSYLAIKGRLVGKAKFVTEPLFTGSDPSLMKQTVAQWFAEWMRFSAREWCPDDHRGLLLTFATTLVSGLKVVDGVFVSIEQEDEEDLLFWLTTAILRGGTLLMHAVFPTRRSPSASVMHSFTYAMKASISKRRMFFLVGQGNMFSTGLGPVSMATGDDIFVLPGGKMPFVLRFVADEDFHLIGDCYCRGAMAGEYGLPVVPRGLPFGLIEAACWEMMRLSDSKDMWSRLLNSFQDTQTFRYTWTTSKTIDRAARLREKPADEQDVVSWDMVNKFAEHVRSWPGQGTPGFSSLFLV